MAGLAFPGVPEDVDPRLGWAPSMELRALPGNIDWKPGTPGGRAGCPCVPRLYVQVLLFVHQSLPKTWCSDISHCQFASFHTPHGKNPALSQRAHCEAPYTALDTRAHNHWAVSLAGCVATAQYQGHGDRAVDQGLRQGRGKAVGCALGRQSDRRPV